MATDAHSTRITVELDTAADPIRGSLDDGSGSVIAFAGWLELMSAFETVRARAVADAKAVRPEDAP